MIFIHLGAGAGDLDQRANFRCGFTEFIKKNAKSEDKIFILEANSKNIPHLKKCYENFSNVNIFNLGISTTNQEYLEFFYVDEDAPHFQVCSSKIDHLKKHYPDSIIKKFQVQSLSINEFFKSKVQNKEIDHLSIDLEGVDYDTLMSIDMTRFIIKNISVEFIHLKPFEKKNMINYLNDNGYSYNGFGYDHNNYDFLFIKKKIFINRLLSKIIWLIGNKHIKFLNMFISTK